ncbi:MAG TPA: cytochrome c3 family protein [Polyangia bacterium]|nr:cytochrome c3 family protein [Polyangia bacterium]
MRSIRHRRGLPLLVAVSLVALAALAPLACARLSGRDGVHPTETDDIRFSHATHAKAKVDCLACHEEIYDAKTMDKHYLPPEAKCLECHKEKKAQGDCAFCHRDPAHPVTYAKLEPSLRLSHAEHIERVKEDCSVCHKTLPELVNAASTVPPMSTCTSCHEHAVELAVGQCSSCHVDLRRFPLRPVSLFSHQGDFVRQHGAMARSAGEGCAQCHDQTFCADCHARTVAMPIEARFPERVTADFIHRADYVSRHAIEAHADEGLCRRCHGQTFCDSCHQSQNLTPLSANPRSPHPIDFSFPGSPNSHGPLARRDISACASCHDQGARSICIDCHRVGGVGGDPHPPGWTKHHPQSEINRNPMCLSCHL